MKQITMLLLAAASLSMSSCAKQEAVQQVTAPSPINCDIDAFRDMDLVVPLQPKSGEEVAGSFKVIGCSSTSTGEVSWKLIAHDGTVLAEGRVAGGQEHAKKFEFYVHYDKTKTEDMNPATLRVMEHIGFEDKESPPIETATPIILVDD